MKLQCFAILSNYLGRLKLGNEALNRTLGNTTDRLAPSTYDICQLKSRSISLERPSKCEQMLAKTARATHMIGRRIHIQESIASGVLRGQTSVLQGAELRSMTFRGSKRDGIRPLHTPYVLFL